MDKKTRIAIIGGGPAGLSAGMYLEQKGYTNYVIYEKSDHVGGKCSSPTYKGKRYEMGAIMGVPSYYAVHDVEKFANVSHADGPDMAHGLKKNDGSIDHRFNPKKLTRLPYLMKLKKQVKRLGEILETKYKGYDICGHRGVCEGRYEGFAVSEEREPVSGVNENLKLLSMPFKDWCEMEGIPLVQDFYAQPFTAFGYGYYDEIPAAYVLKYLDFQTIISFVKGDLWTWTNGTQSIYEQLNEHLKHPALLNSDITKLVRKDNKVFITVNGKEEVFDKVIVTAPLQFWHEYADATKEEKELFSKIDYERYDTTACLIEDGHYPDASYYFMDQMGPEQLGHCMVFFQRWADEPDQPITTYTLRNHKGDHQGANVLDYEATKRQVHADMTQYGHPVKECIREEAWYYFPHVFSEDYANGWYEKVEAMQGQKGTFYAGEVMSFGDMDETIEYSHDLVERFF